MVRRVHPYPWRHNSFHPEWHASGTEEGLPPSKGNLKAPSAAACQLDPRDVYCSAPVSDSPRPDCPSRTAWDGDHEPTGGSTMSYTANALIVHRTARNQERLVATGRFLSKHDRLGTVSGCWKLDPDRAASCAYLLVATDGVVVDVARVLGAEVVPERWTTVTEQERLDGLNPIDVNRVAVITAPTVPDAIESLVGHPVARGRNPVRYASVVVDGSTAMIEASDESEIDDGRVATQAEAARSILVEVARTGRTINYGTLAERVVDETGIEEARPINWWIGDVLAEVSRRNHAEGEPLLSSLVVRVRDQRVGNGYLDPVRNLLGEVPEDGDEHAALQRVRCQRHFGESALR